jgi:hypothetical protein
MTLKMWELINIVLSAFGLWNLLGAMAGFEQVHACVQAGGISPDRRSDEPEYGIRYDHSYAGRPVVDSSGSVHLLQRGTPSSRR